MSLTWTPNESGSSVTYDRFRINLHEGGWRTLFDGGAYVANLYGDLGLAELKMIAARRYAEDGKPGKAC